VSAKAQNDTPINQAPETLSSPVLGLLACAFYGLNPASLFVFNQSGNTGEEQRGYRPNDPVICQSLSQAPPNRQQ
jgi:hypothetical protein